MQVNRRTFVGMSGAGLLGAAASSAQVEAGLSAPPLGSSLQKGARPNLVLFMPDEMRADALSCFGNQVCRTPNFDRLAQMGAQFENCHVQYPVCGASRCSLLTGWPTSVRGHRSLFYFLRPEEPNLFRYLRQAGYDVFWFGKKRCARGADVLRQCQHVVRRIVSWRRRRAIGKPNTEDRQHAARTDPHETQNLFGDKGSESVQQNLQMQLLEHYVNTTGIAPRDKDSRLSPPFYPTRPDLPPAGWQTSILDGRSY